LTTRSSILAGVAAGVGLGVIVLAVIFALRGGGGSDAGDTAELPPGAELPAPGAEEPAAPSLDAGEAVQTSDLRPVALFFAGREGMLLLPETRNIFWTASVTDRARQVVNELLRGPLPDGRLLPALPSGLRLREVYLLPDGSCWVDLGLSQGRIQTGSREEWAAIEAVALSLTLNFPEILRVGLLLDGEQVESLAGHVDLQRLYTGREWLPGGVQADDLLPEPVRADRAAHAPVPG
jgi:hypothetical protein